MLKIEQKFIYGKPFFYLSEQIRLKKCYKKIQVYLGKNIPKDLKPFYNLLMVKEINLFVLNIPDLFPSHSIFSFDKLKKIETLRIRWKYFLIQLSLSQSEQFWRRFAIQFIFESNAIEGSRLSQKEVASIVENRYMKKSLQRKEVLEVKNALAAFHLIRNGRFTFNQRSIIRLHGLLTKNLDIPQGYKNAEVVVNNKKTTPPGKVRSAMADLLEWYSGCKSEHPLLLSAHFHQRFEKIHPFEDGNGRVGRFLFIWMLLQADYPVPLFLYSKRQSYFNALDQADEGRPNKWYRLCLEVYKRTVSDFIGS